MRMMAKNSTSESLQMKIDEAVKKIADEAYEVALRHIRYSQGQCSWHYVVNIVRSLPDLRFQVLAPAMYTAWRALELAV